MPPADAILRDVAKKHGWVIHEHERSIEIVTPLVTLRVEKAHPHADPWDALLQMAYVMTDMGEQD